MKQHRLSYDKVGLGTMMFGWRTDKKEALKMIDYALEKGISFVDTSVSYGRGLSHEILGECIKDLNCRSKLVIATKVGGISSKDDDPKSSGFENKNITRQVDLSLIQLGVDYIDVLQIHYPIEDLKLLEDVIKELENLLNAGKIRAIGLCNHDTNQAEKFYSLISPSMRQHGRISNQIEVNLLSNSNINELQNFNNSGNISVIAWGPLSSGLLTTSVVNRNLIAPSSRIGIGREFAGKNRLLAQRRTQEVFKKLSLLSKMLELDVATIAFSWVMNLKPINRVLAGPSNLDQLRCVLKAVELPRSASEEINNFFKNLPFQDNFKANL